VPAEVSVITSTDVLSRSFAYTPGRAIDVEAAVELVAEGLAAGETGPFRLELAEDETPPRIPLERLQAEVAAMAEEWPGVVGFHLHDLASGESVGFQDRTVFAGASTIKVAIMLYAYVNIEKFDADEERWLKRMIVESDNLSANNLLAAAAGGSGTDWAFVGADRMSTWLQEELGLRHTYLYVPYETTDYIALYKPKFRCGPKAPVGAKPYTEMGACLRAEPESMAQIYILIDQCANGEGLLLEEFDTLSPKRCQEMLDRLETNADDTRMRAGIPDDVRVEHKSGWIQDLQADAGIVRSPGGDYVLSVYVFRPLTGGRISWGDNVMAPAVAAFSRLAYSAYNPVVLKDEE
jgi:beta-lactamase class A